MLRFAMSVNIQDVVNNARLIPAAQVNKPGTVLNGQPSNYLIKICTHLKLRLDDVIKKLCQKIMKICPIRVEVCLL